MAARSQQDPTQRFSDRAENYRKYRPGYPEGIYPYLKKHAGLAERDVIADLGSGTGLLSLLFLEHGHEVFGVEPNKAMRQAAENSFARRKNFHSIDGRAEAIPLPDHSVDFVVAGQAFHWFDPPATKKEIRRILRPGRQAALIWNNRSIELNDLHRDYEMLLQRFGTDYAQVSRRWVFTDEGLADWFAPNPMTMASFSHSKPMDAAGLKGALLSASYAPTPDHPNYEPMMKALDDLFTRYQSRGTVQFEYATKVYHGIIR